MRSMNGREKNSNPDGKRSLRHGEPIGGAPCHLNTSHGEYKVVNIISYITHENIPSNAIRTQSNPANDQGHPVPPVDRDSPWLGTNDSIRWIRGGR